MKNALQGPNGGGDCEKGLKELLLHLYLMESNAGKKNKKHNITDILSVLSFFLIKLFPKKFRTQSAMEYLMTYGWAILIIAVVLVALFQMGVFNSANFAPKAQPGSCQVFKTVAATSLEGICNNELPQYVAQFNAAVSPIIKLTPTTTLPTGSATITAWIDPNSKLLTSNCGSGAPCGILSYGPEVCTGTSFWFGVISSTYRLALGTWCNDDENGPIVNPNSWSFVAGTLSGNTVTLYVNGQSTSATISTPSIQSSTYFNIGGFGAQSWFFNGTIADIQIYTTSLSANDVAALYQEGIGGTPFDIRNLVGWWPLNGNANDYSGNNNNGAATNVIYAGSWTSGYSAP